MQQISAVGQKSPLLHGHVAPHLFHPLLVRMGRDSGQTNPSTLQLDKEQHVVGNQALERKHFHRKEIRSHQNIHMSADEIFPAGRMLSFGAGGTPYRRRILPTVWSDSLWPRLAKAPTMRS